jgi:hypothetical protein
MQPDDVLPHNKHDIEGGARVIVFDDYPEFRPNLTPEQIFRQGAFSGTYWRKIHSGVLGRDVSGHHLKFKWNIPDNLLTRQQPDVSLNKYKVHSGTSLAYWESKGWIKAQDPYGWVEWYSNFANNRRTADDRRQIDRWLAIAGPNGRFFKRLVSMLKRAHKKHDDQSISPVIHQLLHQWGVQITDHDLK